MVGRASGRRQAAAPAPCWLKPDRNWRNRSVGGVANISSRPALRLDPALVQEHHLAGDVAGEAHLVGDDQHGAALVGEVAHHLEHLAHELGVEGRGRLVEQHHRSAPSPAPGRSPPAAAGRPRCAPGRRCGARGCRPCSAAPRPLDRLLARHLQHVDRRLDDVLEDGHVRPEIEALEHHGELGADPRQLRGSSGRSAAVPAGRQPISSPATTIRPSFGVSSRLMQRRNVLLPEPLAPRMAITSPLAA